MGKLMRGANFKLPDVRREDLPSATAHECPPLHCALPGANGTLQSQRQADVAQLVEQLIRNQ